MRLSGGSKLGTTGQGADRMSRTVRENTIVSTPSASKSKSASAPTNTRAGTKAEPAAKQGGKTPSRTAARGAATEAPKLDASPVTKRSRGVSVPTPAATAKAKPALKATPASKATTRHRQVDRFRSRRHARREGPAEAAAPLGAPDRAGLARVPRHAHHGSPQLPDRSAPRPRRLRRRATSQASSQRSRGQ
jgi:hypothetical protein